MFEAVEDKQKQFNNAARTGDVEAVKVVELLLKDRDVDPAANNNYIIKWASVNGHVEIIKMLLNDVRVLSSLEYESLDNLIKVEIMNMFDFINSDNDIKMFLDIQ